MPESEKEEWEKRTGWDLRLSMYADQLASLQEQKDAIINDKYSQALAAIKEEKGFVHMLQGSCTEDVPNFIVPTNGIEWHDEQAGNSSVIHKMRLSYQSASKPFVNCSNFLTYSWSH